MRAPRPIDTLHHSTPRAPSWHGLRTHALHWVLVAAGLCTPAWALSGSVSESASAPALMLANSYHGGVVLADYWVSEKYDGVRAYWDGTRLLTRSGELIAAPAWFTAGWPAQPLDGELWAGRGQFTAAVSAARTQVPDDTAWKAMRYMVFDVPSNPEVFSRRMPAVDAAVKTIGKPWVVSVAHSKVLGQAALQALLRRTVKDGGEGLVLRRANAVYRGKRSDDLLKFKPHTDAEARVVRHIAGKGKFKGMLGAMVVELPARAGEQPRQFKLGTGLSDQERLQPPPVGAIITYRYRGVTDSGLPRFASYLREAGDRHWAQLEPF